VNHFRERFEACVAELAGHSRVRVTHFWMGPPATEAELAQVERELGPLPPSVRAFYAAVNGVQLRWIDRESPEYTDADEDPMGSTYVWRATADASGGDGLVDIGPVATLLETEDLYSDGDEVRAFDTIDDIGMVAFAPGPAVTTRLRIGSDHNVCWDDIPFDFAGYLELLIATYGHEARRKRVCFGREPASPVSLASLLGPAPLPASALSDGPTRIQFEDERYSRVTLRGTALSVHPRGRDLSSLLRVRTDLGEDIYLARRRARPLEDRNDPYERVRQNPAAFLSALSHSAPSVARGMFAGIWGERGYSRVCDEGFFVLLQPEVWRVYSLLWALDVNDVVFELVEIARAWLDESGSRTSHEQRDAIVGVAETLTAVLARAMPARLSAATVGRLVALLRAADAYVASLPRIPSPPILFEHAEYWRSVVAGVAVPLAPPRTHSFATSVGLEGVPLLD
jgi:hypothetical protein